MIKFAPCCQSSSLPAPAASLYRSGRAFFASHEGAYLTAMQLDPDLWESAYQAGVLIVAPTHLMGVVRLVEVLV